MKFNIAILVNYLCRTVFLIGVLLMVSNQKTLGQEFLKNIEDAIKIGNAKKICAYSDKYIDLTFSENTNTYSKKQAEIIIQKFFSKVEPKDFSKINKGISHTNNTIYYIGTLSTSNGTYQVYMFFLIRNATYYLKELRFEKE